LVRHCQRRESFAASRLPRFRIVQVAVRSGTAGAGCQTRTLDKAEMQLGSGFTCASLSDALQPYGSFIGSSRGGCGKTQQVIAGGLIWLRLRPGRRTADITRRQTREDKQGRYHTYRGRAGGGDGGGPGQRACSHAALVQRLHPRYSLKFNLAPACPHRGLPPKPLAALAAYRGVGHQRG
jgi:hypothetical protein